MLTAVLLVGLSVAPPAPSPPPPPPAVSDAPVVEETPAPVEAPPAKISATKARLIEPPTYTAPVVLTVFGTLGTIIGVGMLTWGATLLGTPFTGLGPALGIGMGCVFLVTGLVLGAIGVFGIILTMAEKREYRLRVQEDALRAAVMPFQAPMVVARF